MNKEKVVRIAHKVENPDYINTEIWDKETGQVMYMKDYVCKDDEVARDSATDDILRIVDTLGHKFYDYRIQPARGSHSREVFADPFVLKKMAEKYIAVEQGNGNIAIISPSGDTEIVYNESVDRVNIFAEVLMGRVRVFAQALIWNGQTHNPSNNLTILE